MKLPHNVLSPVVIGTSLIACMAMAHADDVKTTCETTATESVSLYYMTVIKDKEKIGAFYKGKIEEINALAAKHKWVDYSLGSQDVSVSQSSYGQAIYDVTVSVSFQTVANYDLVGQLTMGTDAYSISSSRYSEERCPDEYSY